MSIHDDGEDDDDQASDPPPPVIDDVDPRVRQILELVYQVEGVVGAKVWAMPTAIAIGVRVGNGHGVGDVLARIASATVGLREPGEAWDFGQLEGDA